MEIGGGRHLKMEGEIEVKLPQARECLKPPEAERGRNGFCPTTSLGSMALPTLCFHASGLHNCEIIWGPAQITPLFYYKIFYYKIMSV